MKSLNLVNCRNGEVSKSAKVWLWKSIFYVKKLSETLSNLGAHFLLLPFSDNIKKWCPIFDSSLLLQFSKFEYIWIQLVLAQNLSNFVTLPCKTPQPVLPLMIRAKENNIVVFNAWNSGQIGAKPESWPKQAWQRHISSSYGHVVRDFESEAKTR